MQSSFNTSPIFLVGAERSGTTLLRLMLNSHSKLAWCNEFEYAVDLISPEGWPELDTYYQWLETHRIFQATNFEIDPTLNYPQLIESFLIQKRTRDRKPLVGATVHRHFNRLLKLWSDAKFIHIVRDGRDVARSCIGMGWAGNVWTGIERWIEAENLWAVLSQSLPGDRQINVTYESLITNPKSVLEDICNFLNISFESQMLSYDKTTSYDLPDAKFMYQWKRKLSNREIQLIESKIGNMLLEKNYELSNLPSIEVTPAMVQKLKLQDWLKRVQFRIDRFGFPLFFADSLSRRLQLNSWQKNIRLKMNDIEELYLK